MKDRRFPQTVYRHGEEPDPRFTLANERTFLAWIRTSLALIVAGIALEAFELPVQPGLRLLAASIFILLGLVAPVHAWFGWMRVERRMRQNQPLPGPTFSGGVSVGVAIAGLVIATGFFFE